MVSCATLAKWALVVQALKNAMTQLSDVGETGSIVPVVYSYLEILDGPSAAGGRSVEMTLASEEPAAEVENKKAMLCAHLNLQVPCLPVCCGV